MTRRRASPLPSTGASPLGDWPETIIGGKYVRLLQKHVEALRDESPHGNRQLFLDDVFILSLLAFHNPTLRSLRTLEDFSQTRQAQKYLSLTRVCRSTLSDFLSLSDPNLLQPLLKALRRDLERKRVIREESADLHTLLQRTIAVDGTFLPALADVAWAVGASNQHRIAKRYRARIDCQLHVGSFIPELFVIPDPGQSETSSAAQQIAAGKIYVYDRGFSGFELINAHYEQDADSPEGWHDKAQFVIRYKPEGGNSPVLQDSQERPRTGSDDLAGVLGDRVGYFRGSSCRHQIVPVKLREVLIQTEENGEPSVIRLITNLHDVSAATIGLLYRQRWQIELFFRWLKSVANFTHLLSHTREGLLTELYVTLIGVMLMYLQTGYRPSKYMFALLSTGADLDELMPILRRRERERELARQAAGRRRVTKQAEKNP
jgi:hypothetical protein